MNRDFCNGIPCHGRLVRRSILNCCWEVLKNWFRTEVTVKYAVMFYLKHFGSGGLDMVNV